MKHRLFVGIPVQQPIAEQLQKLQSQLIVSQMLRLTRSEDFHATVCFLGNVDASHLSELSASLARVAEQHSVFELSWDSLRVLEKGSAGLVWAQLRSSPAWQDLVAEVREISRPFMTQNFLYSEQVPHITLARWKAEASQTPHLTLPQEVFSVDQLCLYESHLDQSGARYTILERFPFQT